MGFNSGFKGLIHILSVCFVNARPNSIRTRMCAVLHFLVTPTRCSYRSRFYPSFYVCQDIIIICNLRTAAFKAYCVMWVRRSNFLHQTSPRVSPRESTQRRKVELCARNVREFCLNADLHFTFRGLLHAVKLRHGTDGFTSPPKERSAEDFFVLKIRRLRPGANPRTANLGTKGQHATSRPPKPLMSRYGGIGNN